MVPGGVAGLIAFVAFVAPGALFDMLVARARPRPDETTFEEANRVVLVSVVTVAAATCLVLLPRFWISSWLGPLVGAVRLGGSAWRQQMLGVGLGLLTVLAVSMALAWLAAIVWIRRTPGGSIYRESQWYLVFRRGRPTAAADIHVVAEGDDGVRHFGRLEAYSDDVGGPLTQLTLKAPVFRQNGIGKRKEELLGVHRVVLGYADLRRLYVTYGTAETPSSTQLHDAAQPSASSNDSTTGSHTQSTIPSDTSRTGNGSC